MKSVNLKHYMVPMILLFALFILPAKVDARNPDNYLYRVHVPNDTYNITLAANYNYVLDVKDVSKYDYAYIQLWNKTNGANQQFKITRIKDDWYKIISKHSGKALTSREWTGGRIFQQTYTGGKNQQWRFYDARDGHVILRSRSGKILDNYNNSIKDGNPIIGYDLNASNAQIWDLVPASDYRKASFNIKDNTSHTFRIDNTFNSSRGFKTVRKFRIRSVGNYYTDPITSKISMNRAPKLKILVYEVYGGSLIKKKTLNPSGSFGYFEASISRNKDYKIVVSGFPVDNFTRSGYYYLEELY